MDTPSLKIGHGVWTAKTARRLFVCGIVAIVLGATLSCSPTKVVNKPTPTPVPIIQDALKVEKQVNVSFSSYSKDWPVGWQWVDPDEKSSPTLKDVRSGVLKIRIPSQKHLSGERNNAPRYIKAISGDFQIETKLKFQPTQNYQGAGLLIYLDAGNFLRFERAYGGVGGGGSGIRIHARTADGYQTIATPDDLPTDVPEIELRLIRQGKAFTAFYREDENGNWREAGDFESDFPETIYAGLIACNTAGEIPAEFGYIRLIPLIQQK
jgi:regulation of enolase protein 1 (concanavalin A-like superfamily)